jgi:hypothetical protein
MDKEKSCLNNLPRSWRKDPYHLTHLVMISSHQYPDLISLGDGWAHNRPMGASNHVSIYF